MRYKLHVSANVDDFDGIKDVIRSIEVNLNNNVRWGSLKYRGMIVGNYYVSEEQETKRFHRPLLQGVTYVR